MKRSTALAARELLNFLQDLSGVHEEYDRVFVMVSCQQCLEVSVLQCVAKEMRIEDW